MSFSSFLLLFAVVQLLINTLDDSTHFFILDFVLVNQVLELRDAIIWRFYPIFWLLRQFFKVLNLILRLFVQMEVILIFIFYQFIYLSL